MARPPEPKKETIPIIVSSTARHPSIINVGTVEKPVAELTAEPDPKRRIDDIPTPLYWALLVTSAAILILQIWNYLS